MKRLLTVFLVAGLSLTFCKKKEEAAKEELIPSVPPPAPTAAVETTAAPSAPGSAAETAMPGREEAPAPSLRKGYALQVAAWRSRKPAEKMADLLKNNQFQAYVERADIPDLGIYYRVRIGPFKTVHEAKAVGELLKGKYIVDYWVDNFRNGS